MGTGHRGGLPEATKLGLEGLLRDHRSEEVIDATSPIADEDARYLLGRIARSGSVLADAALAVSRTSTMPVPSSSRLQSGACIVGADRGS